MDGGVCSGLCCTGVGRWGVFIPVYASQLDFGEDMSCAKNSTDMNYSKTRSSPSTSKNLLGVQINLDDPSITRMSLVAVVSRVLSVRSRTCFVRTLWLQISFRHLMGDQCMSLDIATLAILGVLSVMEASFASQGADDSERQSPRDHSEMIESLFTTTISCVCDTSSYM
jgi:hypothetical protein